MMIFTVTAALTGSIMGEGGNDTITLDTGGSVSAGISGGAGDDTFEFNGGTVTGTVAGGGDDRSSGHGRCGHRFDHRSVRYADRRRLQR